MSRRIRGQSAVTFGLSFLDVLCCGLGAAVLLLLIVKHGESTTEVDDTGLLREAITEIQEQIAIKKEKKTELERIADSIRTEIASSTQSGDAHSTIARLQSQRLATLLKELQQQRSALRGAQTELSQAAADLQERQSKAEEQPTQQQLTGLMVNNDRVLVLLDASASMLANNLIQIIRLRASPRAVQLSSEKWRSATGAALWVVESMPDGALYQVLSYSNSVLDSRGRRTLAANPPDWEQKASAGLPMAMLESSLRNRQPSGPTDLRTVLEIAGAINPKPKQIMIITDGLPTLDGSTPIFRIRSCPRQRGNTTPLVSPTCRQEIFERAIRANESDLRGIRIDVILLKLEGDSNAVYSYWSLSNQYGGRLLSPVPGWPAS